MSQHLAPGHFFGQPPTSRRHAGLPVTESVYSAHSPLPRHTHAHAYFSLVMQGTYRETCGSVTRECVAPTLVIHPQGESHADEFAAAGGRILNVEFAPRWLEQVRSHSTVLDVSSDLHR